MQTQAPIATATEPVMGKGQRTAGITTGLCLLILWGCGTSTPDAESCLADVEANALNRALKHCDRVVRAHPEDPRPLNDRFLLHTLLQNKTAACQDIRKADVLLRQSSLNGSYRDLGDEIQVRLDSCR